MTPARKKRRRDEIKVSIAPLRKAADFAACVEIQREAWLFEDLDIVPSATLLVIDRCGGILLGAYTTIGEMVGFVCSFLGVENGKPVQHSHMLAVRTAYRNFNIGYRLKLAQRKESLRRKIKRITWTFDPLQPLNAYFNLAKLGACTRQYEENFYGETSSVLHRGLPTDRLLAVWEISSRQVEKRLADGPAAHDLRKELRHIHCINTLTEGSPGLTVCSSPDLSCTETSVLFEIPYYLPEIRNRDLGTALQWQGRMRQVFRTYFRKGYAATDFWIAEDDGRLRAFYLLERRRG